VTRDKYSTSDFFFITGTKARDTFVEAVREVLADDSFKIKSKEAIEAREVAQSLLEWCLSEENKTTLHQNCQENFSRRYIHVKNQQT